MVAGGGKVERAVKRDRPAGLGVVVDRLPEGHPEGEDQNDQEDSDAPPDRLPASPLPAAFVPLDRAQGRHGL